MRRVAGLWVLSVDRENDFRAVHFFSSEEYLVAFLGYLDEPRELARVLGLPPDSSPAELALVAHERFADEASLWMLGEWSLILWHLAGQRLTLLASQACRDPMFFASDGRRVAVSPELRRLARLPWVGDKFDPAGFSIQLSRARLRRIMTGETVLLGARRVVPGTREVFGRGQRHTGKVSMPAGPDAWQGSFDDAVSAIEATLRRIMHQHLQRYGKAAFLLSGGLDSSVLAWVGAQELAEKQQAFFLSSVSPCGSGIGDEREYSRAVAEALHLPITFVCPSHSASVYTPSAQMFALSELPVVSPRHYLYDAFYDAALAGGADAIFDGLYGEMTLTNKLPLTPQVKPLRQRVRAGKAWLREQIERYDWPIAGFHARLSRDLLASLPPVWRHEWRAAYAPDPLPRETDAWGFRPAIRKNTMTSTATAEPPLRHLMPFRDWRLLRLVAAMPARFMQQGGTNRALGRALLKGRLPDHVRLRKTGCPISPDYAERIRRQAASPLERMDLYRASGADDWLDLNWLTRSATALGEQSKFDVRTAFAVQMTAIAAEFFVWWKSEVAP